MGNTVDTRSPAKQIRLPSLLLWGQGVYYLITGIWPLISIESFQRVTGPKTDHLTTGREGDHWLVMTVAVLIVSISVTLLVAAWRGARNPESQVLAATSAFALLAIDVIYVIRGAISPIYLADACLEVVLLCGWAAAWRSARREHVLSAE